MARAHRERRERRERRVRRTVVARPHGDQADERHSIGTADLPIRHQTSYTVRLEPDRLFQYCTCGLTLSEPVCTYRVLACLLLPANLLLTYRLHAARPPARGASD